ncbi:hypothetical protein BpHYR1_052283 [Brachionus plicatilis]|uniref:Uncharacterized protein n=1 Tax=Brachionus plicatilis TaxID=10195 RepID=A0A3M7S3K4_BRAPC|nr:hypothetical protein BpHYR1_052283 [Brachionus plicatilis]
MQNAENKPLVLLYTKYFQINIYLKQFPSQSAYRFAQVKTTKPCSPNSPKFALLKTKILDPKINSKIIDYSGNSGDGADISPFI